MKNGLEILRERGFVAQVTYEEELEKAFESGEPITFYTGFDPTADSMHIGHYIPIMAMAHLQKAGHRPIALMGAGTAMIGDPSGKSDMRKMMTVETIDENANCIKKQMAHFLDFDQSKPNGAIMVNNADWLRNLNYMDFLREIGALFSVNRMLAADCYKQRLERGLTFLEFNYMVMQSYDFLQLFRKYGCIMQTGGDDQWSNILSGADLIRRKEQKPAFALTFKLLLTHDGRKMGKTEKGALWLDAGKTSPYDFYQYWRNVDDADVENCLALLTFLPMEEVRRLGALEGSAINEAKRVLAYEVTKLIHGEEEALAARKAAEALFSGAGAAGSAPRVEITPQQFAEDNRVCRLAVLAGLVKSNGEARRTTLYIGDEKVQDVDSRIQEEQLAEGLLLRAGKKKYCLLVLGK